MKKEALKKAKALSAADIKVDQLTFDKNEAVNEKNVAKNAVSALTREIEWLQKQTMAELQNIDGLVRDRDKMIKDIEKVEGENLSNKMEIKMLENEKKQIKEQLTANKEHLKQMVQNAAQVEKQRDKFSKEASKANTSLMQMVEEVKLKKNMIGELKKENIEFEAKLKQ